MKLKNVVTIGGGTGTFVALSGLKRYPLRLCAVITMMDSGGSSGRLRDELGVLPPGDIRQSLVALSESPKLLRDMFNYRFEKGDLAGHSFGNIFLSTLQKTTGSMEKAINEVGKILRIRGKVLPVTFDSADLCVELEDGEKIVGETHIDASHGVDKRARIIDCYLDPQPKINPSVLTALAEADYILIGPGDLYTSIIPNFLVEGLPKALQSSKAKKIFTMNLMTKNGQTTNFKASNHVRELEKYMGASALDYVLVNTKMPSPQALEWYKEFSEIPVEDDLSDNHKYKIIRENLLNDVIIEKDPSDPQRRSIIRHDPRKLAAEIAKIIGVKLIVPNGVGK